MKSSSFRDGTPKYALSRVEHPLEFPQTVECFFKVRDDLVVGSSVNNHIIHIGFNIAMQLIVKVELNRSLICGSSVLQPKGHSLVSISSILGDERSLDMVIFLEGNLVVARVTIKEGEQGAADNRVNDLVNAREPEGILLAVLIEISIIHTHPPYIIILF